MYAVGRPHPLRDEARARLRTLAIDADPLFTTAEVLQELMHAYLPVGRLDTLDAALLLARSLATVRPIDEIDVATGRNLHATFPSLSARDLLHLASCYRHSATGLVTFDRNLAAAWKPT